MSWRSGRIAARTPRVAFGHLLVLRHRIVFEDLALEDPDLHAAGAVGGERSRDAEVDIGAQGMQRYAAFAIPFRARDLGAAETARAVDADALGAEPNRRLHGALHGAAERDAALELLGDRLRDQRGVELGLADFDDVDDDVAVGQLGDRLPQLLDVGALLADHHARTRRMHRHPALLVRALDDDLRHRRLLQRGHQLLTDLHVLVQQRAVLVLAGVPARIPGPVDAEPQTDRIDLLTHDVSLSRFALNLTHDDGQVRERLQNLAHAATAARMEALQHQSLADKRLGDDQFVDVEIVIVLGVGDRRLQALLDFGGDPLLRELQVGERRRDLLAANELGQK